MARIARLFDEVEACYSKLMKKQEGANRILLCAYGLAKKGDPFYINLFEDTALYALKKSQKKPASKGKQARAKKRGIARPSPREETGRGERLEEKEKITLDEIRGFVEIEEIGKPVGPEDIQPIEPKTQNPRKVWRSRKARRKRGRRTRIALATSFSLTRMDWSR